MPNESTSSPLRLLAPVALAVCVIAFFVVIAGSGGSDEKASGGGDATETSTTAAKSKGGKRPKGRRPASTSYTVKAGDTLGSIAEKTSLTVEQLQRLNPELDPQALVSGQKIKLRE